MRHLLALAVLLTFPAAARAGTVEVRTSTIEIGGRSGTETVYNVFFTAGPGEVNDVRFAGAPHAVQIQDDGAPLTAGPGAPAVPSSRVPPPRMCPSSTHRQAMGTIG